MREFKTSTFGETVDLDDPKTYDYLPDNWNDLDNRMFKNIGWSLVYMDWLYWDIYSVNSGWEQRVRVKELITTFSENRKNHYDDILWMKEQVFLFEDEIENMC